MSAIQSIICYNGGAGGDFLKAICCQQKNTFQPAVIRKGMTVFDDYYFKLFCQSRDIIENSCVEKIPDRFDINRTNVVENSHYYHRWFQKITPNIYFINYPDNAVAGLIKIYIQKRHRNNLDSFIDHHKASLPEWAQSKLNNDNFLQIFSTLWLKQLKLWRANASLTPIDITDFFDLQKLQLIVEQLTGQPIKHNDQFQNFFLKWTNSNHLLKNIIF